MPLEIVLQATADRADYFPCEMFSLLSAVRRVCVGGFIRRRPGRAGAAEIDFACRRWDKGGGVRHASAGFGICRARDFFFA